jgi:hypothetical protein
MNSDLLQANQQNKQKKFEFSKKKQGADGFRKRFETTNLFPQNSPEFIEYGLDEDLTEPEVTESAGENLAKVQKINKIINEKLKNNYYETAAVESSDTQDEVLVIKQEDTVVIDDMKVAAGALSEQIAKLEWWQDIKSNVDKSELARAIGNLRQPGLAREIMERQYDEAVLINAHSQLNIESLVQQFVAEADDRPVSRLNLLGGMSGVFDALARFRVKPDFKLFNTMLQVVYNDLESEELLLKRMQEFNCKPDTDFVNFLIARKAKRKQRVEIDVMKKEPLLPFCKNIHLYLNFVLGCVQNATRKRVIAEYKNVWLACLWSRQFVAAEKFFQ